MSSRGRSRGRGYFGRGGGGGAPYRQREEHPSHRGGEEHHSSSHYRGGGGSHFSPRGGSAGEYSSRHHKEIMGGGPPPHHSSREHHSSGRGEERYHHRRGGSSDRSGYDHREHHSSSRRSPPPPPPSHRRTSPSLPPVKRHEHVPLRRHEQILSKLAPEEQYALTKALVATVLQESEGREGRGYREERGLREDRERGGYRDESSGRDFRERRPPPFAGPSSRYQSRGGFREDRGRGFYRGRGFRGAPRGGRYESGLHQRLSIPYRGGHDTGYRRKYADYEQSDQPFKRQRLNSEGDAAPAGTDDRIESHVSREDVDTDEDPAEADGAVAETKKADGDVDTDEEAGEEGSKKNAVPLETSTEVERAPWREGDRTGRLFVELQCPHCPAQCSITLKEYKYHLSSGQHSSNMNRLAYKHSQLLMRIRKQQRHQQKQLEDDYLTEHPDQAEVSVSRFCGTCKLNYRCLGGDIKEGLTAHCKTRLHKMQHNYLHPRCLVCRQKGEVATRFKSRMVYEHHVASITHMKNKMEKLEMCPDDPADEDAGDLDGFMTVDSVGEDEEAGLEEHDEITGDAEAQELAKKAAEAGADDVEDDGPEMDDGTYEPIGMSYVQAKKVYFCQLCLLGLKDSGVKRHCSTPSHRTKYFAAKKTAAAAKEAAASSRRKSSDFPRSGGRAEDRDEEEDDEEDETAVKKDKPVGEEAKEAAVEKGDQKNETHNGDKDIDEEKDDNIEDEDDKDDSEKDYEEYNEKYEYTDPNHEDYEEEAPDEDELWDEMDKLLTDPGDDVKDEKPATNGDKLSSPASSAKQQSPSASTNKKPNQENAGGDKAEVSPKLKRRLRSAAKKEDTDEEEAADEEQQQMEAEDVAAEEEEEEEEEMEDEDRPVAEEASEEGEGNAAPHDVDTDDE